MRTEVTMMLPREHVTLCGLVARLIPTLTWRHSGLGMLQAYVHEGKETELRVHVWHPSLRHDGIEESGLFHDHRFDLDSQVLVGAIKQADFELEGGANGPWCLYEVLHARAAQARGGTYDSDHKLLPQRYHCAVYEVTVHAGKSYFFPKRAFHGTHPDGLTVTLVTKSHQEDAPARILAPYGKPVVHALGNPLPELSWQHVLNEAEDALMKVWRND